MNEKLHLTVSGMFPVLDLPIWAPGRSLINEILDEHLYKEILVYFDNILIYTDTLTEHVKLV